MSDAPSVQRIMCGRMYIRAGRIPHVRGSSSLEESYQRPRVSIIHVGRRAMPVCKTAAKYKENGARREVIADFRSRMWETTSAVALVVTNSVAKNESKG